MSRPLFEPASHAQHGMTREECRGLQVDLEAAGVPVVRIEEPAPGMFWLVYRSERLRVDCTVTNAAHFREIVAAGLNESLPASVYTPRTRH